MIASISFTKFFFQLSLNSRLLVLQNRNPTIFVRFKSQISEPNHQSNSTNALDFLVNSCGLSLDKATSAAKKIHPTFKSERPNSVLKFLQSNGFSKTQIAKIISMYPRLLFSSVERTLKAKVDVFRELGFSESQFAELMVCKPIIFFRSIKCQIVPSVECVRRFVKTEENVIRVIKRSKLMLDNNPRARLEPNISVLRDCNVPESRIAYLMMSQPGILMLKAEVLERKIEEVKNLGFQTESGMFTVAMHAKCSMSVSTWNSKVDLLKEWGWSEEQIIDAFKRVPLFMTCSETKMKEGLDYFAKTLNWDASVLSRHPKCLLFSLRTRVMPRVEFFKILMSKNVFRTDKELPTILDMSEKRFLRKFAAKYQDELSELLKKRKDDK